jgi:hypothetical protein
LILTSSQSQSMGRADTTKDCKKGMSDRQQETQRLESEVTKTVPRV